MLTEHVKIPCHGVSLNAELTIPHTSTGVVVVAHGGGCDRRRERGRAVARSLAGSAFATLLLDVLAAEEGAFRPSVLQTSWLSELFSERLVSAVDWLSRRNDVGLLGFGLCAAGRAAVGALRAAAARPRLVDAIVVRGVNPRDAKALEGVQAPTLFIVSDASAAGSVLDQGARSSTGAETRIEIVSDEIYCLETPEAVERMARLARDWFREYLGRSAPLPALTSQPDID